MCSVWKKQEDELAEFRVAFQCIHITLGSDCSLKEVPSFYTTDGIPIPRRILSIFVTWALWTLLFCSHHFKIWLLSCAFLEAVLRSI